MESECAAETNQSRMKEGGKEEDEREREGVREEGWKDGDSLQPWLRFDLFSLSFPGHSHSRSVSTRRHFKPTNLVVKHCCRVEIKKENVLTGDRTYPMTTMTKSSMFHPFLTYAFWCITRP